jgi:hypothetical protein
LNRVAVGMAPLFAALNTPLCPIAGHGPMQHDPLDPDDEAGDS